MRTTVLITVFLTSVVLILGFNKNDHKEHIMLDSVVDHDEQPEFRTLDYQAFKSGEKLTYRLHYGLVDAGEAVLEVKKSPRKVLDRELYHVVGTGKSLPAFDWFFKVRDRYETYIDKEGVFPWIFIRRIKEGGYSKEQDYVFHQHKKVVDNGKGKKFEVPNHIQDMLSSLYYCRTLDLKSLKEGDIISMQTFLDDEVYDYDIRFVGREEIKIRKGTFKCMKFTPVVQEGRVFKHEDDLQVWITDDENKIPVLAKAKILVGSIKMQLTDYEGLANPIAKK
jgi:hypothetical protein